MAVVNSFNQIFIPGIDVKIASNLDTALSTNLTIDAINTNLALAGGLTEIFDAVDEVGATLSQLPTRDALPTFATYSNYSNNPYWNIYDSNVHGIGSGYGYTDAEMYSSMSESYWYTNNNISSNSFTTQRWVGATCFNQADGHWMVNLNPGYQNSFAKNFDNQDSNMPYFGVIVGERGVRQKFSLFLSGTTMKIMPRGGMEGYYENLNINSSTYMTTNGTTSYGMVGYNDRTRTLVAVFAKDGSNNYRMHIWKNQGLNNSLNSDNYHSGTLRRFLSEAKIGLSDSGEAASYQYFDFQWQANSSQSYNESRYRMRVVPGDNGLIGMARFVPSNITHYATYDPAASTLNTSFNTISNTTSYGIEQGQKYGMRHQITWDNNWVAAFAPYYYYGSGVNVFFIDTRDPRNYYTGQWSSTSEGGQILPIQENKFIMGRSQNSDGNVGMYVSTIDPEGILQTGRDKTTTRANGSSISLTQNDNNGMMDTQYTSTNYPALVAMPHWKVAI
jgi:hypothetical protein